MTASAVTDALAADKSLATLPFTAFIRPDDDAGIAADVALRAARGFYAGAGLGVIGALIYTAAMLLHSFWLLCAGAMLVGIYNANGQYYRFAAADSAGPSCSSVAPPY